MHRIKHIFMVLMVLIMLNLLSCAVAPKTISLPPYPHLITEWGQVSIKQAQNSSFYVLDSESYQNLIFSLSSFLAYYNATQYYYERLCDVKGVTCERK